jgi:hypothetical protein
VEGGSGRRYGLHETARIGAARPHQEKSMSTWRTLAVTSPRCRPRRAVPMLSLAFQRRSHLYGQLCEPPVRVDAGARERAQEWAANFTCSLRRSRRPSPAIARSPGSFHQVATAPIAGAGRRRDTDYLQAWNYQPPAVEARSPRFRATSGMPEIVETQQGAAFKRRIP